MSDSRDGRDGFRAEQSLGLVPALKTSNRFLGQVAQQPFRHLAAELNCPYTESRPASCRSLGASHWNGAGRQPMPEPVAMESTSERRPWQLKIPNTWAATRARCIRADAPQNAVGHRSVPRCNGRVGKRRRGGKPVGAGDVGGDRHRNGAAAGPGTTPDHAQQAEGRDELTERLAAASSHRVKTPAPGAGRAMPWADTVPSSSFSELCQDITGHVRP